MPIDLQSILISALIGLIVLFLRDRLSKQRSCSNRIAAHFNNAANDLDKAFSPEVAALSSMNQDDLVFDVLNKAFGRHEAAVVAFRDVLDPATHTTFDAAWTAYLHPWGEVEGVSRLIQYYSDYNPGKEEKARQNALSNIKAILSFAKRR